MIKYFEISTGTPPLHLAESTTREGVEIISWLSSEFYKGEDAVGSVLYTPQSLTPEQQSQSRINIGLGNADNTSDADKPISTATQQALDTITTAVGERVESTTFEQYKAEQVVALDGKADKATTLAGYNITDAYTKGEVDAIAEAKANTDDYYPQMSVGFADNLVGRGEAQDAMFSLRPSGGKSINDGTARITSIKGNSVVWNQLVASDSTSVELSANHKYFTDINGEQNVRTISSTATIEVVFGRDKVVDLTKMFDAGNEPTSVEEFYARKPIGIDEYAYNEGVILDNRVSEIKSISNNAYDPTLGYARVIGGKMYNFDGTFGEVQFSATIDGAREAIEVADGGQYTMPNDGYVWLSGSDICVCLVHSYEKPYSEHEVDIVNLAMVQEVFPEGMRSAGTACDEIRYNKTTKKWEKVTRIGVVDLGTMAWRRANNKGTLYTANMDTTIQSVSSGNCTCPRYVGAGYQSEYWGKNDKVIGTQIGYTISGATSVMIKDSKYLEAETFDIAAFKAEMSGVMLYYELAEPIIEPIEGSENWNLDYLVWDFGTEEAIASVPSAPFRANIVYEFNAVDDIRWAYAEIKKLQERVAQLESAQASENPITE